MKMNKIVWFILNLIFDVYLQFLSGIGIGVGIAHESLQLAFLFSAKAAMPSFWSSVAKVAWKTLLS